VDPGLTSIRRDAAVRADYRVRRRKYDENRFLIRHTEFVVIDEITDAVWVACERGCTVGEIITAVEDSQHLPLGEAAAAVVVTLERLRARGFVTYVDPH
jgi:hypothetical protein